MQPRKRLRRAVLAFQVTAFIMPPLLIPLFVGSGSAIVPGLLSPHSFPAPRFPLPYPSGSREKGELATYDEDGAERWRGGWTQEFLLLDGTPSVRFTASGEGRHSPFRDRVAWNVESYWEAGKHFRPLRYEREVKDSTGKTVRFERRSFDWTTGRVQLEQVESGDGEDRRRARDLEVPADTLTSDGLPTFLRALLFESRREATARLLTDEPRVREVEFRVEGIEKVETPAGEFECYRIKMDVRLGFLSLFRFLVPETRFWFTKDPPHHWVRYEGLETGRGSPEVVRALVRYEGPETAATSRSYRFPPGLGDEHPGRREDRSQAGRRPPLDRPSPAIREGQPTHGVIP